MPYGIYGVWLAIDFRLLWLTLLLSTGLSFILMAFIGKGSKWHEYITLFVSILVISFIFTLIIIELLFGRGVIITRDFFPLQ